MAGRWPGRCPEIVLAMAKLCPSNVPTMSESWPRNVPGHLPVCPNNCREVSRPSSRAMSSETSSPLVAPRSATSRARERSAVLFCPRPQFIQGLPTVPDGQNSLSICDRGIGLARELSTDRARPGMGPGRVREVSGPGNCRRASRAATMKVSSPAMSVKHPATGRVAVRALVSPRTTLPKSRELIDDNPRP